MAVVNIPKKTTLENWVDGTNQISQSVGDLSHLPTGASSVVGELNTTDADTGVLTDLTTPDQTDLVTATDESIANALIMVLAIGSTVN